MRLELTRVGLLVKLANHYTTRGASSIYVMSKQNFVILYRAENPLMQNTVHVHEQNFGIAQPPLQLGVHAGHPLLHR